MNPEPVRLPLRDQLLIWVEKGFVFVAENFLITLDGENTRVIGISEEFEDSSWRLPVYHTRDLPNYAGVEIEVFEVKEVGAHISPGIFCLLRILKPFAVTRSISRLLIELRFWADWVSCWFGIRRKVSEILLMVKILKSSAVNPSIRLISGISKLHNF